MLSILLLVLVAPTVLGLRAVKRSPLKLQQRKLAEFEARVAELATGQGSVLIDCDNVRGKADFKLDHEALILVRAGPPSRAHLPNYGNTTRCPAHPCGYPMAACGVG